MNDNDHDRLFDSIAGPYGHCDGVAFERAIVRAASQITGLTAEDARWIRHLILEERGDLWDRPQLEALRKFAELAKEQPNG